MSGKVVVKYDMQRIRKHEKEIGDWKSKNEQKKTIKLRWMKKTERYAPILLKVSWISGGLIEFEMSQEAES